MVSLTASMSGFLMLRGASRAVPVLSTAPYRRGMAAAADTDTITVEVRHKPYFLDQHHRGFRQSRSAPAAASKLSSPKQTYRSENPWPFTVLPRPMGGTQSFRFPVLPICRG
jgi:hypothetical protein